MRRPIIALALLAGFGTVLTAGQAVAQQQPADATQQQQSADATQSTSPTESTTSTTSAPSTPNTTTAPGNGLVILGVELVQPGPITDRQDHQ